MGETLKLTAKDGVTISAYKATPQGKPKGAMVVVQEIFGVNPHIRNVTDRYAAQGYLAIAPAVFDRVGKGIELSYTQEDVTKGADIRSKTRLEDTLADIEAAVKEVASAGPVGVVGYCWGGTLAYAAACRVPGIKAAVGYYGGGIAAMLNEKPKVPVMLHFGEKDKHISMDDVNKIKKAYPSMPVYVYDADHGFNCDARGSYDKPSAELALKRTLAFFDEHLR
ncbi:MAG: dienelactone hydrolase family protein [Hyphomicrobiales bacterium]|nr:dienelactone hydrolase family protein [Hyphomicrobiales bacterium]MBV9112260.1 dienelactone hydrolase family protein [Hyphomicrobiales bacterium]MBV9518536.1 dienelactone hydrolase family protein [Hyphomicrobiales bacterium]